MLVSCGKTLYISCSVKKDHVLASTIIWLQSNSIKNLVQHGGILEVFVEKKENKYLRCASIYLKNFTREESNEMDGCRIYMDGKFLYTKKKVNQQRRVKKRRKVLGIPRVGHAWENLDKVFDVTNLTGMDIHIIKHKIDISSHFQ